MARPGSTRPGATAFIPGPHDLLYRVARTIAEANDAETAWAFLTGSNPQLGERSRRRGMAEGAPAGEEIAVALDIGTNLVALMVLLPAASRPAADGDADPASRAGWVLAARRAETTSLADGREGLRYLGASAPSPGSDEEALDRVA